MPEYIEREAFIADKKWLYCTNCDKRKGKKRGKMITLYEIGEAPCKSCGIHDMLEEVECYPAADVRPVVRGKWLQDCDYHFRCSVCGDRWTVSNGNPLDLSNGWNFCPNCGADMRPTSMSGANGEES